MVNTGLGVDLADLLQRFDAFLAEAFGASCRPEIEEAYVALTTRCARLELILFRPIRAAPAPPLTDDWLKPAEGARLMKVSRKWLDRRWRRLPFCAPMPDGAPGYRLSTQLYNEHLVRSQKSGRG